MKKAKCLVFLVLLSIFVVFSGHLKSITPHSSAGQTEPQRFFLDFADAALVYIPSSNTLQITTEGNVLSYGSDWEKCKLKPFLYHLRQNNWKGFHWQVDTSRKEVYRVTGGTFCRMGGTHQKLDIEVEVVGGDGDTTPQRFLLKFKQSYLVYAPSSNTLQISASGMVLSYGADWQRCKLQPTLFHLKQKFWNEFYWQVNTIRKEVYRINPGGFCELGSSARLKMGVRVVQ